VNKESAFILRNLRLFCLLPFAVLLRPALGTLWFLIGQPVLEVLGQYLHILLLHDVRDGGGADLQLCHCLVCSLPEPVMLGLGLGQIQLGHKLAELLEHYGVEVLVVT